MLARIDGLGDIGIISDVPPSSIPDNALSGGFNVRAFHGRLENFPGYQVYTTPPVAVHGLFGFLTTSGGPTIWVEAGLNKVYVFDGATHSDITRVAGGDYTTDEYFDRWTGGVQNGFGFLCNGKDSPQQWDQVNTGTPLRDMIYDSELGTTWDTQAGGPIRAFGMRPFSGSIFAYNITVGANFFPSQVQWCDFISPGTTNPDWIARPTNSAGSRSIGDSLGQIIDGAPFRDEFVFYKEDSVYRCAFTGSALNPFVFQRLPEFVRIINRNCIGIAAEMHVVAAPEDVYLFDGNTFKSILTHRMRKYYLASLWEDRKLTAFVASNSADKEIWICLTARDNQEQGQGDYPNIGIVWNWHDNSLSHTDLPRVRAISSGAITGGPPVADTYETPPDIPYDDDLAPYDGSVSTVSASGLVGSSGPDLLQFGGVATDGGTPKLCWAERTGLILNDTKHNLRSADGVNRVVSFRPYLESSGPVNIQVGNQFSLGGPIYWAALKPFDPATQNEVKFRQAGRFMAWRIWSQTNVSWSLAGMEIEYKRVRDR